jgi:hypothetical protein
VIITKILVKILFKSQSPDKIVLKKFPKLLKKPNLNPKFFFFDEYLGFLNL